MSRGTPSVAKKVPLLDCDLGMLWPLKEKGRASSAELPRVIASPPVYKPFLPLRLLPNAGASENCDVAALLTLPLMRRPSEGSGAGSSCGFGVSAALLSFGFGASLLPGAALLLALSTGVISALTALAFAIISSRENSFIFHLPSATP